MASANWHIGFDETQTEGTEMFELVKNAKYLGTDAEGFAMYGVAKPEPKSRFKLDSAKIAKAKADREAVNALIGE